MRLRLAAVAGILFFLVCFQWKKNADQTKQAICNVNRSSCIRRLQQTQKIALQLIGCPPFPPTFYLNCLELQLLISARTMSLFFFFSISCVSSFSLFCFVLFSSLTKSKYAAAAGASAGGHKGLGIILNHEFCTLDLTPVAPDYSLFFLLFPLFVPSNRATTGGNLTVMVQTLLKGREGWSVQVFSQNGCHW